MVQRIGKYAVQKVLGSGSFGEVYQAIDPDLQKNVAIKKLKARGSDQPADTRVLFTREARDTSKLSHPNIVIVHGFGIDETDGAPYLVMELLEGETLERNIRRRAEIPLVEKIEIMHQVAEGLQFAHNSGVIHRDIKPANIMVLSDGTAKVMDFAVAPEGFLIGTPAYMAPEQFTGHRSDVLTDIFGFGAVYYELLSGERPFDPDRPERAQTSHHEPPPVSTLVAGCPPWLDLLLDRILAKARNRRYQSLEEMLVETRPALQKLKQERATQLAAGIGPLMNSDREAANRLIAQVLRLDPLNRQARELRATAQSAYHEEARVRAQELVARGEAEMGAGDFEKARQTFEEALELDRGNTAVEKLLESAQRKSEDRRMSLLILDEVIDDVIAAGPSGLLPMHVESSFKKLTRAVRLDEGNRAAADLRAEFRPVYDEILERREPAQPAPAASAPGPGAPSNWYEQGLADARKARRLRDFDHAEGILRKLMAHAQDDRAGRELAILAEDRAGIQAAQEALRQAAARHSAGDTEGALRELDAFAEANPRRAPAVEGERRKLQKALDDLAARNSAG